MTRKGHQDTKTLQVWPGGESYTYRGDLWGPEGRRSLRAAGTGELTRCNAPAVRYGANGYRVCQAHVTDQTPHPLTEDWQRCDAQIVPKWRKGTAEEWRRIRVEARAERLQREEIYCCDSALVDELIKLAGSLAGESSDGIAGAFGYEEIRNLYADPSEWDAAQCREYAEENGIDLPTPSDCPCANPVKVVLKGSADPSCASCGGDWPYTDDEDDSPGSLLDQMREACREYAQDHPAEVYEWYRVSGYLCALLHAIGEVTIDNDYGYWFGRQCTGQSLIMDGTLQRVAARLEAEP